jgi:hypothetical protein
MLFKETMTEIIFNPKTDIKDFEQCHIVNYHENMITKCISDLFINPRKTMYEWSSITEQTAHIKIGYVGQHLASVVLNTKGCKTAARGEDCLDKSEVKSCSRIDQSDKCNRCKINITRFDKMCPKCNQNDKIKRNNDSKWLLTIRSEDDLKKYLTLDRLVLIIEDYSDFDENNYDDIAIKVYEIYPKKEQCKHFKSMLMDYYENIYLANVKKNPQKVPAPKNLWPYSFQFYMCNPVKIFECKISNYIIEPCIDVIKYINHSSVRTTCDIEKMPLKLLSKEEKIIIEVSESEELTHEHILKLELR